MSLELVIFTITILVLLVSFFVYLKKHTKSKKDTKQITIHHQQYQYYESLFEKTLNEYISYFMKFTLDDVTVHKKRVLTVDVYKELKEEFIVGFIAFIKESEIWKFILSVKFSQEIQLITYLGMQFDLLLLKYGIEISNQKG